jgi:hypothetical protein
MIPFLVRVKRSKFGKWLCCYRAFNFFKLRGSYPAFSSGEMNSGRTRMTQSPQYPIRPFNSIHSNPPNTFRLIDRDLTSLTNNAGGLMNELKNCHAYIGWHLM